MKLFDFVSKGFGNVPLRIIDSTKFSLMSGNPAELLNTPDMHMWGSCIVTGYTFENGWLVVSVW